MSLRVLAGGFAFCIAVGAGVGETSSQGGRCPYRNGIPAVPGCVANARPTPIPSGLGGSRITATRCTDYVASAIASLYSYDDLACRSKNSVVAGGSRDLKLLDDVTNFLPPNARILAKRSNFAGSLYCATVSNTLILAFRGSISLTPLLNRAQINDWFKTNFLQHLGPRPRQYQYAEDAADLIKTRWILGAFDGACGPGRPTKFLFTGHSKGGGQAQFASARLEMEAVVLNSDMVNPLIFSDWTVEPDAVSLSPAVVQSVLGCSIGLSAPDVPLDYFASGRIRDIRMTNDPLTEMLIRFCGNNLPHASVEWLFDSLSCSRDGHGIETVVRELELCSRP